MDIDRFRQLVAQLERDSAVSPAGYRIKVAALALLGFGILALLLGAVGAGLLLIAGVLVAVAFSGGWALLLALKFGKLLLFLAIPLWYLVKASLRALLVRLPAPEGREITRAEAPALFAALDRMRERMRGPRFHHVLVIDGVNAAIVQRPALGLIGWPRNYLLLGLPLLESLPPDEALAVVAHEYGHLAGSHGHFSAFIYRLRHTWGTVQAFCEHIEGWLGRLVAPLVRWYVPYFNAYTFVLARADEYQADAASAELVGAASAARALKRVNLVAPRHERFMAQTFERIDHEAAPPRDLMQRWAAQAGEPAGDAESARWLADALDRTGDPMDTHPTLRARLAALPLDGESLQAPPPPAVGPSAAQAWLGPLLETLRAEAQARWAEAVAGPWSERHAEVQQARERLAELRALAGPDAAQQIEQLRLTLRLEPQADLRAPLAAFNAAHPGHALGLYLEGTVRLDRGERDGLALLEQAVALDPEASKPAFERAHAFLSQRGENEAAEAYSARWRERDALESERARQARTLDPAHALVPHGLDAPTLAAVKARLGGPLLESVDEVYLARRVLPADPAAVQLLVGVKLSWWGLRRGRQQQVLDRLAAAQWPVPLLFATLDGRHQPLLAKFRALPDARLV